MEGKCNAVERSECEIVHPFALYYGDRTVKVISQAPIGPILRLCSTNDGIVFVLNNAHELYTGSYDGFNNCIKIEILKESVIDIDLFNEILHIVKENGSVYKINISTIVNNHWEEVNFSPSERSKFVQIRCVKSNSVGTIFLTNEREAYGSGVLGDILTSSQPVKLDCLNSKRVYDISAGLDFFIMLASDEYVDDDDEENASTVSLCDLLSFRKFRRKRNENVLISRGSTESLELEVISDEDCSDRPDSSKEKQLTNEINTSIKNLIQKGNFLVNTEVLSFGSRNSGLLGTGDHIKRAGVNTVVGLSRMGVCAIVCGREHSIAKTIDGRLYQWGMNHNQQIQLNGKISDLSAPKELAMDSNVKSTSYSILDACCGDLTTFLLSGDLNILELSKKAIKREFISQDIEGSFPLILSSNDFVLQNHKTFAKEFETFVTSMQLTVRSLLQNKLQIEFFKYLPNTKQNNIDLLEEAYELYQRYLRITYLLVLCLQSVDNFYHQNGSYTGLLFIKHSVELIQVYSEYSELYCDIRSINGFNEIKKIINCVDIGLYPECEDVFFQPFTQISNILKFLECLSKKHDDDKSLIDTMQMWRTHFDRMQIDLELADNSREFWQRSLGNTQLNRYKQLHRRVILDSNRVPLKINGGKFSTHSLILFSDFFCQHGSNFQIYPLSTIWVQIENEVSIKVITPEKRFTLTTKSHEDKMLWYDQFEKSINAILEKPATDRMPKVRCAGYKYDEKHPKYGDVWCYGRWKLGELHGVCHLEYPDGKVYFGEMQNGDIEGFGKMLLPSIGMYEGCFRGGKFHGYGIYEMRDNETYEGNFRDGLFEGHGTLSGNVYTYVGQFVKNVKHGYGILDDAVSGDKYMGMFSDNKRSGPGVCITMNGDYFEGIYKNDVLAGDGLAIFESGCYYEGELNMYGPTGHGKYYIPQVAIQSVDEGNGDSVYMKGSIISGVLGGRWEEVKISNGTISLSQTFLKYPKAIGEHIVNNSRKWHMLFENWEEEVFGGLHLVDTNLIWSRVAVYMKSLEEKDKIHDHDSTKAGNYFAKNITMQLNIPGISLKNSTSLDKISLCSTNSLSLRRSSSLRLGSRRKSYSNEILFDRARSVSRRYRNASQNIAVYSTAAMNWKILYDTKFAAECNVIGESRNKTNCDSLSRLEFIPNFGLKTLSGEDLRLINEYLEQAFKDRRHPLYILNQRISNCFYQSYGCWKVKPTPVLSSQAMCEWESISLQMYRIVQKMFPALGQAKTDEDGMKISHISLLYPIVLSEGIYSTLFVLYANKYSQRDELYRQRLLSCEKKTNSELIQFLGFELFIEPTIKNEKFNDAIATLKMVKEKFCPHAMLSIIRKSMQLVEDAFRDSTDGTFVLGADNIMPLAIVLVLRAVVPHLGAELALLEDLLGNDFESVMIGYSGYCYTTIKATYEHIISDKFYHK